MARMTPDSLAELLRKAAGEGEGNFALNSDNLEAPFADLGYDSLAMLEVTGMVEREYQVNLSDDTVHQAETPQQFLDLVNSELRNAAP